MPKAGAMELLGMDVESPGLFKNFLEFINDNVIMMLLAATCGNLASSLASCAWPDADHVMRSNIRLVLGLLILAIIRMILLQMFHRSADGGLINTALRSMLPGLVWFLRVPAILALPDYLLAMYKEVGWNPEDQNTGQAGKAFMITLVVFFILFALLLATGMWIQSRPDNAAVDASWSTFGVQCIYMSVMSCAGKAMHFVVVIVEHALDGPTDIKTPRLEYLILSGVVVLLLTGWCWFALASTVPNQTTNPNVSHNPWMMLHLTSQQYVYVYVWSFASVNWAWYLCWSYIGHTENFGHTVGMACFLLWLCFQLLVAFLLASSTKDHDFYDMGADRPGKATFCMMNFWVVDNMTWWAWAQFMVYIDTDAGDLGSLGAPDFEAASNWSTAGINLFIVLGFLVLVGVLHGFNQEATLFKLSKNVAPRQNVHVANYHKMGDDQSGSEDSEDEEETAE